MLTSTKAEEMVNKNEVCYYLNVFFNGMSKGQVDVIHNRASSGDQVERVTRYKYFFTKCSRIVKYHHRRQEHHSKSLFYVILRVEIKFTADKNNMVTYIYI